MKSVLWFYRPCCRWESSAPTNPLQRFQEHLIVQIIQLKCAHPYMRTRHYSSELLAHTCDSAAVTGHWEKGHAQPALLKQIRIQDKRTKCLTLLTQLSAAAFYLHNAVFPKCP